MTRVILLFISICFLSNILYAQTDCSLILRAHFLSFCDNGQKINNYTECLGMNYQQLEKNLKIAQKFPECEDVAEIEFESFKIQQEIVTEEYAENSYDCKKARSDLSAVELCTAYAKSVGEFKMRALSNRFKIDEMCGKKVIGSSYAQNRIYDLAMQKNIVIIDPTLIMLTEDYNKGLKKLYDEYNDKYIKYCGE